VTTTAGDSAKEFAAAVNSATGSTGISATAVTKLKLSSLSAADTVALTINGTNTASVAVTSTTDLRGLKDAINAKSGTTGVTASLSGGSNAALELVDVDGDDISVALVAATNATTLSLSALDRNGSQASSTAGTDDLVVTLLDAGGTAAAGSPAVGAAAVVTGQVTLSSYGSFNVQVANDNADYDESAANTVVADGEFFGDGDGNATSTSNASLSTVSTVNVSTRSGAESAMAIVDGALDKINNQRAKLGALSNRIDHTIGNLQSVSTNTQASQGRIQDADFAVETSNLVRSQILSQAATAMLAQANASKQTVLTLLQG
jgi:flagellin